VTSRTGGRPTERNGSCPARLREPDVLARQRDALGAGDFDRGARDVLTWLIVGGRGPISGQVVDPPVSARAIVRELAAAEALIFGPAEGCRRYGIGVEHALMWAEMVTPEPPAASNAPDEEGSDGR
jgi:hypothetical protein